MKKTITNGMLVDMFAAMPGVRLEKNWQSFDITCNNYTIHMRYIPPAAERINPMALWDHNRSDTPRKVSDFTFRYKVWLKLCELRGCRVVG